jgi:hypothetical protein
MKSKRKPTLKTLIKQVNAWCERAEDGLNSTDSNLAEFCSDFGYGEGEIKLSELDEYCDRLVNTLFDRVQDDKRRKEILAQCSVIQLVGVFNQTNEIFSASMGECEEQIDDDLWEHISKLSDEQFKTLRHAVNCHIPEHQNSTQGFGYFNHSDERWVLILDVDNLYRALQDIPARIETHEERRAKFKLINGGAA